MGVRAMAREIWAAVDLFFSRIDDGELNAAPSSGSGLGSEFVVTGEHPVVGDGPPTADVRLTA